MSWRTTGILFVVLVVLAALVFLQRRQTEPQDETPTPGAVAEQSSGLLGQTSTEDVVRLDITTSPGVTASFSREEDGAWAMTVPTSAMVISQTVSSAVTGLVSARTQRSFAAGDNPLEAYGLADPPREIVVAATRDEQVVRYRLQVGNETPTGNAYYLLKEGDERIHLIAKTTLDTLFALATNPPQLETLSTSPAEPDESDATPASP